MSIAFFYVYIHLVHFPSIKFEGDGVRAHNQATFQILNAAVLDARNILAHTGRVMLAISKPGDRKDDYESWKARLLYRHGQCLI